jgi:hypothetical protein
MNKLAVIIPFYKRHELTKLCFDRIKRQSKRLKFDVIVAGSEGKESRDIAKDFKYIEVENKLGKKLNSLLSQCKDYDGVIVLGSDNFMSDSIIKMYQEIDCSKEVYYSFDDIYIYSAIHQKIASDFDYTRAGNGIGVARLYTKPTLKKMNYKVWDANRVKGLDGSANRRCKANSIEEIRLSLKGHWMYDIKIDQNISAQNIIHSGHKFHPISSLKKLGKIGEKIVALKPEQKERIYTKSDLIPPKPVTPPEDKIKAVVLKDFNDHRYGDEIMLKKHIYIKLKRNGFVSPFVG